MHQILRLQEEYLKSNDSHVLSEFYIEVLRYCKYILKASFQGHRAEDAYDLASKLAERLMVKHEPVIEDNPAGYLNSALKFMGKPRKEVLLYDWMNGKVAMIDSDDSDYQNLIDECLAYLVIPKRIREPVERCLRKGESAEMTRQTISEEDRKTFDLVMAEVRKFAERKIDGKSKVL